MSVQLGAHTDAELISLYAKEGKTEAVGELFRRYASLAVSVAAKYFPDRDKASDMSMRVFEKLLSILKNQQVEQFRPWLYRVVQNECLMEIRKQKEITASTESDEKKFQRVMENEHSMHHEGIAAKEEMLQHMERAIGELEEGQQTCIRLFYLEEKSYSEVSSLTGFDMNQVKSYIQNGKRNLQLKMKKFQS